MMRRTWFLWDALYHPYYAHPFFQFLLRRPPYNLLRVLRRRLQQSRLADAAAVVISVPSYVLLLPALFLLLPLMLLVFMLLNGLYYGLVLALVVSGAISHERERGLFHMLSMTPIGALGTGWIICTAVIYRDDVLERVHITVRIVFYVALAGCVLLMGLSLLFSSFTSEVALRRGGPEGTLVTFVAVIGLLFFFYIEHIQSLVLGSLAGVLTPLYISGDVNAGLVAAGSFLALQIGVYLLAFFSGFVLLPSLLHGAGLEGHYAAFLLVPLRVLGLYLLREALIEGVWRLLLRRVNALSSEFVLLTNTHREWL